MKAVTGRRITYLHDEILYRIGKWNRRAYVGEQMVVAAAVQQIKSAISRTSLDRNRNLSRIVLVPNCIRRRGRHRRPSQLNQRCFLTAIQRQRPDTFAVANASAPLLLPFHPPPLSPTPTRPSSPS